MWNFLIRVINVLRSFALFGFAFMFLNWFFKGLFGKRFYIFWIWLILAIGMYISHKQKVEQEFDSRTGAELWESQYGKVN